MTSMSCLTSAKGIFFCVALAAIACAWRKFARKKRITTASSKAHSPRPSIRFALHALKRDDDGGKKCDEAGGDDDEQGGFDDA